MSDRTKDIDSYQIQMAVSQEASCCAKLSGSEGLLPLETLFGRCHRHSCGNLSDGHCALFINVPSVRQGLGTKLNKPHSNHKGECVSAFQSACASLTTHSNLALQLHLSILNCEFSYE